MTAQQLLAAGTSRHLLILASAVTSLFAWAGFQLRGVTRSGAIAGFSVALVLFACTGLGGFLLLVALFVVTYLATRFGRKRKQQLGTAERQEGRDAWQVLANVGVAAVCAIAYRVFPNEAALAACAAVLAEAAADTVASECGQTFRAPTRLITTGALVPPGSNGGVSVPGSVCGALAALGMALVACWAGFTGWHSAWVVCASAIAGVALDSLLGATLEGPGGLSNNAVNLFGTALAAFFAWALVK